MLPYASGPAAHNHVPKKRHLDPTLIAILVLSCFLAFEHFHFQGELRCIAGRRGLLQRGAVVAGSARPSVRWHGLSARTRPQLCPSLPARTLPAPCRV